jgi:hypothetical protein
MNPQEMYSPGQYMALHNLYKNVYATAVLRACLGVLTFAAALTLAEAEATADLEKHIGGV